MEIPELVELVVEELQSAIVKFGPFKNGHEGWAVIREEVDELWDEVKMPAIPKPAKGTAAKAKAKRRAALVRHDEAESAKVRERSSLCEVIVREGHDAYPWFDRCWRPAVHVHHMIKGRGKRGVGISALAKHKQHSCDICHRAIEGGVGGKKLLPYQHHQPPIWTDVYRSTR